MSTPKILETLTSSITESSPAAVPETSSPETTAPVNLPLDQVLNRIRIDSRRDPRSYLEETVAPDGGE